MKSIILIAHDLRSAHNVGSLLRTAEGLGCKQVYLTGYTPYPKQNNDDRLPHLANKIHQQIAKTALGAEANIGVHKPSLDKLIDELKSSDYKIAALEQSDQAIDLSTYKLDSNIALIVGNEVEGIDQEVLSLSDIVLQIPMIGKKESFNVAQATAMALYHLSLIQNRI